MGEKRSSIEQRKIRREGCPNVFLCLFLYGQRTQTGTGSRVGNTAQKMINCRDIEC